MPGLDSFLGRLRGKGGSEGGDAARARKAAERGDHVTAARSWLAAARAGSAEAQRELAILYEQGLGVLADGSAALRWYQAAAEGGDMVAQGRVAAHHANGFEDWKANPDGKRTSLPKDIGLARQWAEKAALQGHLESKVLMGWLLTQNSEDSYAEPDEAAHWYGQAAEEGSHQAKVGLALLMISGKLGEPDHAAAHRLFSEAAAAGNATAWYYVGVAHQLGHGADIHVGRALEAFETAADGGVIAAARALGLIHRDGLGVKTNIGQAETWLRRAALRGDVEGMALLADLHAGGVASVPNPSEAATWYLAAAERRHVPAQVAIGLAYLNGDGVATDPVQAVRWFMRAAAAGNPVAAFRLGLCCLQGIGTAQDYEMATHWFERAGAGGHADGMYNLGVMYWHGTGPAEDRERAMAIYAQAAEMGSASAQFRIGRAYALGEAPYLQDMALAVEWTCKAAEQGHVPGQVNLGRMLMTSPDPGTREVAHGWLTRAMENGSAEAMTSLAQLMAAEEPDDIGPALAMAKRAHEAGDPHAAALIEALEAKAFRGEVA